MEISIYQQTDLDTGPEKGQHKRIAKCWGGCPEGENSAVQEGGGDDENALIIDLSKLPAGTKAIRVSVTP